MWSLDKSITSTTGDPPSLTKGKPFLQAASRIQLRSSWSKMGHVHSYTGHRGREWHLPLASGSTGFPLETRRGLNTGTGWDTLLETRCPWERWKGSYHKHSQWQRSGKVRGEKNATLFQTAFNITSIHRESSQCGHWDEQGSTSGWWPPHKVCPQSLSPLHTVVLEEEAHSLHSFLWCEFSDAGQG